MPVLDSIDGAPIRPTGRATPFPSHGEDGLHEPVKRVLVRVGAFGDDMLSGMDKGSALRGLGLWVRLLDAGAHFVHLREVTWRYNFHSTQYHGRVWREQDNLLGLGS